MIDGPFALALLAGMVATVNPCGFALLPAYLAAFVGLDDTAGATGWVRRWGVVGRAVAVSAVLTAGFVTVFGVFGAALSKLIDDTSGLWWMTTSVGLLMIGVGVYLLTGRSLVLSLPKLQRGGADGTYASMYLFGMSYALASLSCASAPFLSVTTVAFDRGSYVSTLAVFLVYALGMGLVVAVLTTALALARAGVVARVRSLLPVVNRVAGGLLVVAGAYVAYYGWYSKRVVDQLVTDDPIVDIAERVRREVLAAFPDQNAAVWWAVGVIAVLAVLMSAFRRARSGAGSGSAPATPQA